MGSLVGDPQAFTDLRVATTFGNEPENLAGAGGQRGGLQVPDASVHEVPSNSLLLDQGLAERLAEGMRQELLQTETKHEAVGNGEGADRQQAVRRAAHEFRAVDALIPKHLHDHRQGHSGAAGAAGPALKHQRLPPALRHEAQDALQVRGLWPVALRALRREHILNHDRVRFPRMSEHRLRVIGLADADDLPAPRISREKGPDLRMVADGKLPLKAFDEHAAR